MFVVIAYSIGHDAWFVVGEYGRADVAQETIDGYVRRGWHACLECPG